MRRVVAGPAIVHSGAGPFLARIIRAGFVQVLFGGNAIAAHDVEAALLGTSLGVALDTVAQIETHLLSRNYEGFMRRGRMKSRRGA